MRLDDGINPAIQDEIESLRQQVADLQRQLAQYTATNSDTAPIVTPNGTSYDLPVTLELLEQFPFPIVIYREDGLLFMANQGIETLFGVPRSMIVKAFNVFDDPASRENGFTDSLNATLKGEIRTLPPTFFHESLHPELGVKREEGWFAATFFPLRSSDSNIHYAVVLFQDVTGQMYAEHEQRRLTSELQQQTIDLRVFKALADNALDGIAIVTLDGTVSYANKAHRQLSGFGERAEGSSINEYPIPAERDYVTNEVLPSVMEHGGWRGKLTLQRPDMSTWIADTSGFLLTDEQGNPLCMAGMFRDITEQQTQSQRLHLFEALVENASDSILVYDMDGMIQYANPAAQRMLHIEPSDTLVGRSMNQITTTDEYAQVMGEIAQQVRSSGVWHGLLHLKRFDGQVFPSQQSIFSLTDPISRMVRQASIGRDITDQLRMEQERVALQEQIIQAQQAALRELSMPLIPITDELVAMPLIGSVDSRRAQQVLETLLEGVSEKHASFAILDITGVPVVDTQVANALIRTAQAVQLLGAQMILTGIRPEVAQTLVGLGTDLRGIVTRSSLQAGIAYATKRMAEPLAN